MKKVAFCAAAAALCGGLLAVESANVVGYASAPNSVEQFNFLSVGFNAVGYNTCDIQQIKISDGGAGGIGWGTETFELWAGAPDVVAGSGATYYDPSIDPTGEATDYYWGDDEGNRVSFSILPGQGVVIGMPEGLAVQMAGQVSASNAEMTSVEQFNFLANPFAAPIDIQNIKISDGGAGGIGWGTETFELWAGAPDVVAGSGATYYDPSIDPTGEATDYYWGDDAGNKITYSIPVGQSFVINMPADLDVTITPPYSL